ncbi:MAG: hypothetical protein K8I82_13400 [Anaerolineae bacterium]|nr:hypothetical protein [Anaerolineae bacterium]
MNFGKIDRVALFGGSQLMGSLCRTLNKRDLKVAVFTGLRHLEGAVDADGTSLRQLTESLEIPAYSIDDINAAPELVAFVTPQTIGLALGAAWVFEPETVRLFEGKLLDFMGIALPQYRGGAHYSWQILRQNRMGACNLQVIHGGANTFHRGEIIKHSTYFFPTSARIPQDYFDAAIPQEMAFLESFFDEVEQQKEFSIQPLQEDFSSYYPFLYTRKHGWINWQWDTDELERFICAFDTPYDGASTLLDGQRVFLKSAFSEMSEGNFHPFQTGLIYRKTDQAVFVASRKGALVIQNITDENGQNVMNQVQVGQRFYTPQSILDEAMMFEAVYDARGLKK